jgi:pimeloyl-ACP methyl ester carboxylesterase
LIEDEGSRIDVATAFLRNCFGIQPSEAEFAFMLAYNMLCPFEVRRQIGKWSTDLAVSSDALRQVDVPTLIVHGKNDILVLPGAAENSASLIQHARVSLYDGCGHSVFFEAAPEFNAELALFVTEVAMASSGSAHSRAVQA